MRRRGQAAQAHSAYAGSVAAERAAQLRTAEASLSARRARASLAGSEANLLRATSQEAVSRGARDSAVVHASIERQRLSSEQAGLSAARAREGLASSAAASAHVSAHAASVEAAHAGSVAASASVTRAVHDASPRRLAYLDTLSPTVRTSLLAADYGSPARARVQAQLEAYDSPARARYYSEYGSPARTYEAASVARAASISRAASTSPLLDAKLSALGSPRSPRYY